MKVLTINIPNKTYNLLKLLVKLGYYTSMSEAVRKALRDFTEYEFRTINGLEFLMKFLRDYSSEIIKKIDEMAIEVKIEGKVPKLEHKKPITNVDILENEEIITQIISGERKRTRVREFSRGDVEVIKDKKTGKETPLKIKSIEQFHMDESK